MADEDQVDEGQDNLKDLRKAADEGRKARQEAENLKRELAFSKAGIDTETPIGKMMFDAYKGELDRDSLTASAREVGAIRDAPTDTTSEPTPEERAQSRERADLVADSGHASTQSGDPFRDAEEAFKEARRNGDPAPRAFGAAMAQIVEAHQRGDARVIPQTRRD